MVTHDVNEAFKLGERIIILNEGSIEQDGTVDDIINNPATEYVSNFISGVY